MVKLPDATSGSVHDSDQMSLVNDFDYHSAAANDVTEADVGEADPACDVPVGNNQTTMMVRKFSLWSQSRHSIIY